MIKNILIVLMGLVCVFLVTYANIQANEAKKQLVRAEQNRILAQKHEKYAEMCAEEAYTRVKSILDEKKLIMDSLKACKGL